MQFVNAELAGENGNAPDFNSHKKMSLEDLLHVARLVSFAQVGVRTAAELFSGKQIHLRNQTKTNSIQISLDLFIMQRS